jgi:AmmeMemoRadiSam system protein A
MFKEINREDAGYLLQLSHSCIRKKLGLPAFASTMKPSEWIQHLRTGLFASIYRGDELAGCIGQMESKEIVPDLLPRMVESAAFHDRRFSPVKETDLPDLWIEISLMGELIPLKQISDLQVGVHGLYLKTDRITATYLPQVAVKMGWNALEMVEHCSEYKAGIGKNGWKQAALFIYEVARINERELFGAKQ